MPEIGVLEWFRVGEYERAERALDDLKKIGIQHLRTGIYWADFHRDGAREWYDWLLGRCSRQLEILPCVLYTPPSMGVVPKTSSPPREPRAYADFIDLLITQYGRHFEYIELWNEPNNLLDWDWRADPEWSVFSDMMGKAAFWAKQRGKRTVLGGTCPTDTNWLRLMGERGLLKYIDICGLHGFPGTWEPEWHGWEHVIGQASATVHAYNPNCRLWITEAGYSTWRNDEINQVLCFLEAADSPLERLYWYHLHDLHPDHPHEAGFHQDERHYHMGMKYADGTAKLLFHKLEEGGTEALRALVNISGVEPNGHTRCLTIAGRPEAPDSSRHFAVHTEQRDKVLVVGGAGFVTCNVAADYLERGRKVLIYDNLSRRGVEQNLRWLHGTYGSRVEVEIADVRDVYSLRRAVRQADTIFHFAAQVAVTNSLVDPRHDFEVNALGTMNLLEELRALKQPPSLLFTSTNKVYGSLDLLHFRLDGRRYRAEDPLIDSQGIDEHQPLDFHSPYGCSKGTADQYVRDYARCYGLPATVFRMSCIYGPHQFGTEDQGWVAHFLIRALAEEEITIYGDGCQVRDILFVDDLVRAMVMAHEHIDRTRGRAFNIGGGPANAVSLDEVLDTVAAITGRRIRIYTSEWRKGDQCWYVSDSTRFSRLTGWKPQVSADHGIRRLADWLAQQRGEPAVERHEPIAAKG